VEVGICPVYRSFISGPRDTVPKIARPDRGFADRRDRKLEIYCCVEISCEPAQDYGLVSRCECNLAGPISQRKTHVQEGFTSVAFRTNRFTPVTTLARAVFDFRESLESSRTRRAGVCLERIATISLAIERKRGLIANAFRCSSNENCAHRTEALRLTQDRGFSRHVSRFQ